MNKGQRVLKKVLGMFLAMVLLITTISINEIRVVMAASKGKVKSITITNVKNKKLTLEKGKSKTLKVKVKTKEKKVSKKYTFKSSNSKIVKVVKKGNNIKVTAKKAGKAKITVKSKANKKKKYVVTVTVKNPAVKKEETTQNNTNKDNTSEDKVDVTKEQLEIISMEVLNEYSVQIVLSKETNLSEKDIQIMTKKYSYGQYNKNCKIENIYTEDNKTYLINLVSNYEVEKGDFVKSTININNIITSSESVFFNQVNSNEYYEGFSAIYGEYLKYSIDIAGIGYSKIERLLNIPEGVNIKLSETGEKMYIEGTPIEKGYFEMIISLGDEIGNIANYNVALAIGAIDTLSAGIVPINTYLQGDEDVSISQRIFAKGGSGEYMYTIIGESYGLSTTGRLVSGIISEPGNYNVTIEVTDFNYSSLKAVVTFEIEIKEMKKISGKIVDINGQPMSNVEVKAASKNLPETYIATTNTDENGNYTIYVEDGIYDICAYAGNIRRYSFSKEISTGPITVDISMPLYKVTLLSDSDVITPSVFGKWYDNEDNYIGTGNILYLKKGEYKLNSSGDVFGGTYTATLSANITNSCEVIANVTADIAEITGEVVEDVENKLTLSNTETYYTFTAKETGIYTFQSMGNYDLRAWLYDENGVLLATDDDSGDDRNFTFTYQCEQGKTYYFVAKSYSGEVNDATISIIR